MWQKKSKKFLLVFQYLEFSLRPELSSPPCFRIQGGSPERDGRRMKDEGQRKSLCLILDVCKFVFADTKSLISHKSIMHKNKSFSCGQCSTKFKSEMYWLRHKRLEHKPIITNKHNCSICDMFFSDSCHFEDTHKKSRSFLNMRVKYIIVVNAFQRTHVQDHSKVT